MRTFIEKSNRFLEMPLDLGPRVLLLAGVPPARSRATCSRSTT